MEIFQTQKHRVDFCVVGGGLSGLCAAVAAARNGARVILMQERPMLGGNASSEIRMWVCGARGADMRETGLIEELLLENLYRNTDKNYSVWDSILYEMARQEPNLTLLLNCTCLDAKMNGESIVSIRGWQMTTQRYHQVDARLFADCSGDSILAPLTGAEFRIGREARAEFNESIEPEVADRKTMGMSCLIQARQEEKASHFIAPAWAEKIDATKLKHRVPNLSKPSENFWYLELGGDRDTIDDTEVIRDELLALAYGVWDYLKNDPEQREVNSHWRLDWVGILPGKRESRRYVGDVIVNQRDVMAADAFADVIAYGGWTMDDHHPSGFRTQEPPNVFHPAPSPFALPYRALYSKNIANLLFAGRNISVSHAAMSATRVMATCALLGQAAGTAAALAVQANCLPRDINVMALQHKLMDDDCYLPGLKRPISTVCARAVLRGDGVNPEALRDGVDRPVGGEDHAWIARPGDIAWYDFANPTDIGRIRLVFDSDLNRETLPEMERVLNRSMFHNRMLAQEDSYPPKTLVKAYRIHACMANGDSCVLLEVNDNHQRLCRHVVNASVQRLGLEIVETWGLDKIRIFAFEAQ